MKTCPCGKTPTAILLYAWKPQQKWVFATPECCGEWMFEFRANYSKDEEAVTAMAVEAWDALPRNCTHADVMLLTPLLAKCRLCDAEVATDDLPRS